MLWKKAFIKAKGGADILRFFNDLSRKIYLFGVSNNIADIDKVEEPLSYILMPHHRVKIVWNIVSAILLVYTATLMPYKTAFLNDVSPEFLIFEYFIDILFFVDIIVMFFSAYED